MTKKMFIEAITKFLLGVFIVAMLIFIPAGTFNYWQGQLFMAVLFVPMFLAGIVMMLKNPALLKSRLNAKEKQSEQSLVIKLSGLMFISGFVIAGLNFRLGWYILPKYVSLAATLLFLFAYLIFAEVLRENTFLSRTIEVRENQTVVDTGLYGIVRHPMYSASILLFISMPLILGSLFSLIIFLVYPFIIAVRIKGEEAFLEKELNGYSEYKQRVKYRILPFIW